MSGIFDQIINYSPPLIVSGTVNYKGTWDASTNNPPLSNPPVASTKGDYYVVSTAGTQFSISFAVGDWIISSGTAWEKVDLTDAVSSVFGRTGAVVGVSTDYSAVGLTNTAIGASSPSTGAFTTVTASSTIAATGAVTGSNLSGTNTGDQTTITGNAGSATILQTARNINGVSFNGSADITVAAAAGTLTGATLASGVTASSLTSLGTIGSLVATTADINGGTIDGTTVGATTPSTVAATTMSASGQLFASKATDTSGASTSISNYAIKLVASSSNTINSIGWSEDTTTSAAIVGYDAGAGGAQGIRIYAGSNSSLPLVADFSSTGLAVTGALSSTTGANFATSSGSVGVGTASPAEKLSVSGVGRFARSTDASQYLNLTVETGNVVYNAAGSINHVWQNAGTEQMRLDSIGNLLVGTTSAFDGSYRGLQATNSAGGDCAVFTTTGVTGNIVRWNKATSGDNLFIDFYTETSITNRGGISYNRALGLVAYNTTSDYRAKDILGQVQNPGATIDALKVYEGQMKGATKSRPMLVAHEAQEHAPYAVTGEKDAVNEDGTPKYQQMDVSALVPLLLAELQSLRARVAALESK